MLSGFRLFLSALLATFFAMLFVALTTNIALAAKNSTVKGMRFWQSPDRTRVVLDLSYPVKESIFILENPSRVVIDLPDTEFGLELDAINISSDLVAKIRKSESGNNGGLRIVLDLKHKATQKAFALKPYQQFGHRLVIDLADSRAKNKKKIVTPIAGNVVIAVDAGHGGEDPGASSANGKREKHITLAIAKKVVAAINRYPNVNAFLTRDGDYYVGKRKRAQIARKNRAHLFVSIHADAFPKNKKVRGSSIWTLSTKGSDSELGNWLASKANEDLLGVADDLDLEAFDDQVAAVLVNLSQEYAIGSSIDVASMILKQIGTVGKLHSKKPRRAAFTVLMSPGIPSILVETGFISNSYDEKNLTSRTYQKKFAKALAKGLHAYLQKHPPEGTKLALKSQEHKVKNGDTLSGIASLYGVSVRQIKLTNNMSTSSLQAGQTIEIPR